MIGARKDRDWWDSGPATPPEHPPRLRSVLFLIAAFAVVLLALAIGRSLWL